MATPEQKDRNEKQKFFFGKNVQKLTPSTTTTSPGDVLMFGYKDLEGNTGNHMVLVLGNERGSSGVFKGKSGTYLSAVKIGGLSDTIFGLVLDNLYKNVGAAYSNTVKAGLLTVVGQQNYRTYIINSMYGCLGVKDAN